MLVLLIQSVAATMIADYCNNKRGEWITEKLGDVILRLECSHFRELSEGFYVQSGILKLLFRDHIWNSDGSTKSNLTTIRTNKRNTLFLPSSLLQRFTHKPSRIRPASPLQYRTVQAGCDSVVTLSSITALGLKTLPYVQKYFSQITNS